MEDTYIMKCIEAEDMSSAPKVLKDFTDKYERHFGSIGLSKEDFKKLWKFTFRVISDAPSNENYILSLKTLRILSRDKACFNAVVEDDQIEIIIKLAGLSVNSGIPSPVDTENQDTTNFDVLSEAQKCLSNMIFNSAAVQKVCASSSFLERLVERLREWKRRVLPQKIRAFDVRMLFLVSALCASVREPLCTDYHCFSYLVDVLEESAENASKGSSSETSHKSLKLVTEEECGLVIDVLKVLYNLATTINRSNPDEEQTGQCSHLIQILRLYLFAEGSSLKLTEDIHSHSVNLLLLMPPKLYQDLIMDMPTQEIRSGSLLSSANEDARFDRVVEYDGKDLSAVAVLLDFLHLRLNGVSSNDNLMPVLTLFVEMTQNCRLVRKFVRLRVIPPLRDVSKRPEEGSGIKNKLCLLMTSAHSELSYLSASLLFIICKENVGRLIKYTGYGNAAGLLASRGLMLQETKPHSQYSSDSESSDTEEYSQLKDKVNPVTGCLENPKISPLDGMTEEQKEYEAIKLVNALDKLTRNSVIQPCHIGPDGKPHPIEHVMQLQNLSIADEPNGQESEDEET